jgi:hypothetical protein
LAALLYRSPGFIFSFGEHKAVNNQAENYHAELEAIVNNFSLVLGHKFHLRNKSLCTAFILTNTGYPLIIF